MTRETDSSSSDLAAILRDYVPRSEHEQILDAFAAMDEENGQLRAQLEGITSKLGKHGDVDKLLGRVGELEGKLRGRNHRDAFDRLADELRIKKEFRDDVFDLARFDTNADEPDVKSMKKRLKEFFDERESRRGYLDEADEGDATDGRAQEQGQFNPQAAEAAAPGKPRLHTEDTDRGRGGQQPGATKFRYRSSDLSDPEWMRVNAVPYAKAVASGNAVRVG